MKHLRTKPFFLVVSRQLGPDLRLHLLANACYVCLLKPFSDASSELVGISLTQLYYPYYLFVQLLQLVPLSAFTLLKLTVLVIEKVI